MEYSSFNAQMMQRKARSPLSKKSKIFYGSMVLSIGLLFIIALAFGGRPTQSYDNRPMLGDASAIAVADQNKDGEVSGEELEEMIEEVMHDERANEPSQMQLIIHAHLPHAIRGMDQNGNGHIDPREAAAVMGNLPGVMMQTMAAQLPTDHGEYVEIQNRVRNEFKDAVLDLALKNHRNESISDEECFQNCFNRCQWMLEPHTCVDTCNQGCGTDAVLNDPMEIIQRMQRANSVEYGENEANYTLAMKRPGLKSKDLKVEVRGPVLVVQGECREQMKGNRTLNHAFHHSIRMPPDVNKEAITSELENDVLTVYLPKDPELSKKFREERMALEQAASGKV